MDYGNLVFLPNRNTKKADYTGAFLPESNAYAKVHNIPEDDVFEIDVHGTNKTQRREQVLLAIEDRGQHHDIIKSIAFFCHGLKNQIQLGFNVNNLFLLARDMGKYCDEEVVVPIYACSAARDLDRQIADDQDPDAIGGDGGFADILRDALCSEHMTYCRVMAHVTTGHTTVNPWVRFFDGDGNVDGGEGGYWVVPPKKELWRRWIHWLRKDNNRFRFPFMSYVDILYEVTSEV